MIAPTSRPRTWDTGQFAFEQWTLNRRALRPLEQSKIVHTPSYGTPVESTGNSGLRSIEQEDTLELPSAKQPVVVPGKRYPVQVERDDERFPVVIYNATAYAREETQTGSFATSGRLWRDYLLAQRNAPSGPPPKGNALYRAMPMATPARVLKALERKERVVLMLLDGKRSLRDVASLLHRSEEATGQTVVSLQQQGYIEYCGVKRV